MKNSRVLVVKILALHYPERYAVRRLVTSVQQDLLSKDPDLSMEIIEVSDPSEIGKYAFVLILPTLVINEQVACSGRVPTRAEVSGWLSAAAADGNGAQAGG